ncbi:MAG: hypothetical protein D3910_22570, partial [Candidatus Electrothrix sp. ATG2]|nr:hypothetical protein [Candidatus Electrothrix sp. ATG2]
MKIRILAIASLLLFTFAATAQGGQSSMEQLGIAAITAAFTELNIPGGGSAQIACLTDAGYVQHQGESTRILYDVLQQHGGVSLGKGNLLPVHSGADEPLWF